MASSRSGAAANAARALAIGTLDGLNTRQVSAISKHLSWALRHKLNRLGVAADSEGWCRLDQVSSALVDLGERKPSELTVPVLLTVIARSNSQKARYMTRAKDGYTYVRALEFNERHPSGDHSYGRRRNEGHSGVHLRERPRSSLEGIPPWRWSSTVLDSKRILERCDKSLSDNDWSDLCFLMDRFQLSQAALLGLRLLGARKLGVLLDHRHPRVFSQELENVADPSAYILRRVATLAPFERDLIDGLLLEEDAIANSSCPRWIEDAEPAAGSSRSGGAANLGSLSSDTAICTVHNRVRTIKNLVLRNGCWQCRGGFQSCLPAERRRGR